MSFDSDDNEHCDDPDTCRPALPRMKSCLKSSPCQSGSATPVDPDDGSLPLCKKHVAFGSEQVFQADEWDRTPTEISQRLSYDDVLELKMIQRSLPRAQQHHDPLSSRPYSGVFLRHVPIPLLPLNPITVSASPSTSPPLSPPIRSPHSSPPRRTGYSALDLHPNSIFFASPPQSRRKPVSTLPNSPPLRTHSMPPPPFLGIKPHNIAVPPPPPAPSELRPHNIAVPPPPLPPARSSTTPLPPIPSNLPPPKRRFTFLPLLDDTSAGPTVTSTPRTETTLSPPSPNFPHTPTYCDATELETSYNSDTDCSLFASDTEFSTPSLTTASLASSSPPESPGMSTSTSPVMEHPEGNFILNLDTDPDVDDSCMEDSYFPRMPVGGAVSSTRGPMASFHTRHPPRSETQNQKKPNLGAVPSPGLPISPLDLSQMRGQGGARKKFAMPIVALAESSSASHSSAAVGRREGCEYAQLRAGGEGQGHGQGQRGLSQC